MKKATAVAIAMAAVFGTSHEAAAQFDPKAYLDYMASHKNLTAEDLLKEYPAGMFNAAAPVDLADVKFVDKAEQAYQLTDYERTLLSRHSFVVTERNSFDSYLTAYLNVYTNHLPLYVSSDAVLHALHRSYDNMLADVEQYYLNDKLKDALDRMHQRIASFAVPENADVKAALIDADFHVAMARMLLTDVMQPVFEVNKSKMISIVNLIQREEMNQAVIFGRFERQYDFSQLKPRGHYTRNEILRQYFKAMMWLGRTEVYVKAPSSVQLPDDDIRNQCMTAIYLSKAVSSDAKASLDALNTIIERFVGDEDNLTYDGLANVIDALHIDEPADLMDTATCKAFQKAAIEAGARQNIYAQVLEGTFEEGAESDPAAAFMLLGQRFILDSYILANVVFDRVKSDPPRLMPSPLDAMFTLGNDAAAQLLKPELDMYPYAPHLAGLRYLVGTMPTSFWNGSVYSAWLNSIRALNPPTDRTTLPAFMQTGAWWQKTLNTQLTSWAELRHDNLLYAKQSYSGGIGCYYTDGFVEPVPQLYSSVAAAARILRTSMESVNVPQLSRMMGALDSTISICSTLSTMAQKELDGVAFDTDEEMFLKTWLFAVPSGCDNSYSGKYASMLYGVELQVSSDSPDFVIADVHTQPTDQVGNVVGNVLHIGTGKINLAFIAAKDDADGCSSLYVGPVGSFHQHVTSNFKRLTDEEWMQMAKKRFSAFRPDWVYSYLADSTGNSLGAGQNLYVSVDESCCAGVNALGMAVYPNPASGVVNISYAISNEALGKRAEVTVMNIEGTVVYRATEELLTLGTRTSQWNGTDIQGTAVPSGVYVVQLAAGSQKSSIHLVIKR